MNSQSQPASTALQPSSFGKDDSKVQKLAVLLFRLKCFRIQGGHQVTFHYMTSHLT